MKTKTKKYDPAQLVKASHKYIDEYPWLPEALKKCTHAFNTSEFYIYFIDRVVNNWKTDRNILLEDTLYGDVVLDVLKSNEITGVEFYSKLLADTIPIAKVEDQQKNEYLLDE